MIRRMKKIDFVDQKLPEVKETEEMDEELEEEVVEEKKEKKFENKIVYIVFAVLILLGVGTGYLLSHVNGGLPGTKTAGQTTTQTKTAVGSSDTTTFKDWAEGTLEDGGLDGEGSHHLVRDGGPSQTVYLISSIVDLSQFVGKKVKVWGATMAAKKAAWLMDVGKVETE